MSLHNIYYYTGMVVVNLSAGGLLAFLLLLAWPIIKRYTLLPVKIVKIISDHTYIEPEFLNIGKGIYKRNKNLANYIYLKLWTWKYKKQNLPE